ncbi:hypothetical protein RRU94_15825 [Domibacillus sp. DTU_2020_1001157_1_SI_ALB_TIR_016]|uniref:hypothetical protein n=1 Tax=Domibacillus sp. DTU_2020_1001157_1_SI_ALB_TIR_016 TaxID=3077789 RepID=UPI0028E7A829|nr:hypothetical protein [Domibacillus sp. DTU_2020_1001157_1_SI_ALB_TIR_016]WNS82211.1 hypothetical protein RRU94_15825 [Domibacillus sp. DTU_2020_1001157_1_SI_ALB_TIR_016]
MQEETAHYYHALQKSEFTALDAQVKGYAFWGVSQRKESEGEIYFWCVQTSMNYLIIQKECVVRSSDNVLDKNGTRYGEGRFVPIPYEVCIFLNNCFSKLNLRKTVIE